ncbi:hypothetical protein [Xenorhabdus bovienii]|uniref:hypothetical protein n=1 Tax=Xenorhabdus bovienii TaxID=40576 RepID=UPI0023B238D7|nr:hypothetical protein [Xenorhabdus bovienii]MDE9480418.1 hypothetical protein [Xenorhabdus bovienii]
MNNKKELIAHQSIMELHQWIEDVFTNDQQKGAASLEKLLSCFSPEFSMITTRGHTVFFVQVSELFHQNIGHKPSLKIEIDSIKTLVNTGDAVVCQYRETHCMNGINQSRWSVVIIEFKEGNALWRYLHETPIVV